MGWDWMFFFFLMLLVLGSVYALLWVIAMFILERFF